MRMRKQKHFVDAARSGLSGMTKAEIKEAGAIPSLANVRARLLCLDPQGEVAAIVAAGRRRKANTVTMLNPHALLPDKDTSR